VFWDCWFGDMKEWHLTHKNPYHFWNKWKKPSKPGSRGNWVSKQRWKSIKQRLVCIECSLNNTMQKQSNISINCYLMTVLVWHTKSNSKIPYVLAYKWKNFHHQNLKIGEGGRDDLYAGHKFLRKADDVSWARDWRTLRPVERRSAPVGHWHVTLVCVTWYCSKTNGRAEDKYSEFRAALSLGRSQTWAWLAHGWHRKWHIIVARIAPRCDQLLISSQNTRTFCIAASRGMLLMAWATSLTTRYTRGQLICRSTCMRIHYICTVSKKHHLWDQHWLCHH